VPGDDHDPKQAAAGSEDLSNFVRSSRRLHLQPQAELGQVRLQAADAREHPRRGVRRLRRGLQVSGYTADEEHGTGAEQRWR